MSVCLPTTTTIIVPVSFPQCRNVDDPEIIYDEPEHVECDDDDDPYAYVTLHEFYCATTGNGHCASRYTCTCICQNEYLHCEISVFVCVGV